MRRRKPVDSQAAMAEGVDYLLREFKGLPKKSGGGGSVSDGFGGPIEPTFLVAAVDARSEIRAVADFVCDGTDDQEELGAAVNSIYNGGSGQGGILQLTAGSFTMSGNVYAGAATPSCWIRGAGPGGTVLSSSATPGADVDGFIQNNAEWASVTDLQVVVWDDGYRAAVMLGSVQEFGIIARVHAYISPDVTESQLVGAFWVDDDSTVQDCVVENASEGTGIYVQGDRCRITDNYIQSATTQGFSFTGDGIYIPSGSDDCIVTGNTVKGSIANAGIRVGGDRCIIIGNTCPDGITIDSTADGTIIGGNTGTVVDNGTNTVFLDNDALSAADLSPLTTKGDLWGYDTADNRLPVGTDTHVLTADSAEALGVKWATPSTAAGGKATTLMLGGM